MVNITTDFTENFKKNYGNHLTWWHEQIPEKTQTIEIESIWTDLQHVKGLNY